MLDVIMLAMGLGFFALAIGYSLRLRPALRRAAMILDYSLAGLVTAGLLIYLTYALLRPEKF